MPEPSNTDLAVAVAHLEGKVDAYQRTSQLQLDGFKEALATSATDRAAIHADIAARVRDGEAAHDKIWESVRQLQLWRSWMTGLGASLGLALTGLSLYAALHAAGLHP